MNIKDIKTQEEFQAAYAEFAAKHPEMPKVKPIECLNLVMRKEFAKEILNGTKRLEFRGSSPFYYGRLIDKDVENWMQDHIDDEEVSFFVNPIRPVKKMHFYNYANSWHLDVECTFNDMVVVNDDDVSFLRETFGCTDFDDMLKDLNARKEKNRPFFFYFECGKVLDTNLSVE